MVKAYVITLKNNEYSQQVADRCVQSAAKVGTLVEKFYGVNKEVALRTMAEHGLEWTWAGKNDREGYCPHTGLWMFPYRGSGGLAPLPPKVGCSMSHFLLWKRCVELNEPILILEHDSVFLRALPEIDFRGICQINDPNGATPRGSQWSTSIAKRGPGVFPKTWIRTEKERHIPDGLAGNSAYLIKPWAAQEVIDKCYKIGLWINDALICKQLFNYIEEYYPFITRVQQGRSTTTV